VDVERAIAYVEARGNVIERARLAAVLWHEPPPKAGKTTGLWHFADGSGSTFAESSGHRGALAAWSTPMAGETTPLVCISTSAPGFRPSFYTRYSTGAKTWQCLGASSDARSMGLFLMGMEVRS